MLKKESPRKIQSESNRLRAPLKARWPYSPPYVIHVPGIKQTYQDAASWAEEITRQIHLDGAPEGYAEQLYRGFAWADCQRDNYGL